VIANGATAVIDKAGYIRRWVVHEKDRSQWVDIDPKGLHIVETMSRCEAFVFLTLIRHTLITGEQTQLAHSVRWGPDLRSVRIEKRDAEHVTCHVTVYP